MYTDPSGHVAVSTLLISVLISVLVNVGIEAYEEYKGQEKDIMDYVGAVLGGAISGLGVGFMGAIVLGGVGEMVEVAFSGEATKDNLVPTFFSGAFSGAIGFGAGEVIKYAACLIGTGVVKVASKLLSNNKVNRFLTNAGFEGIKIGTKGIFKITKSLASVEGNIITDIFSGLGSGGYSWLEKYFVTHVF